MQQTGYYVRTTHAMHAKDLYWCMNREYAKHVQARSSTGVAEKWEIPDLGMTTPPRCRVEGVNRFTREVQPV